MDRFFASRNTASRRAAEHRSESLSSWTDIVDSFTDALLLTDEGQASDTVEGALIPEERNGQHAPLEAENGLDSSSGPFSIVGHDICADGGESRLTQSLNLGHETLASLPSLCQRLPRETGDCGGGADSLSTSSVDYMWDASDSDVGDVRKFNSLPYRGIYSTTNGSLPGSPLSERRRAQAGSPDQTDKIKTKLLSAWNNMRHGWTVRRRTSFKYDDPIWILGKSYHNTRQEREDIRARQQCGQQVITSMECFKRDFTSRIWFTYRQNFPILPRSQYTTDVGWGCMIRSGQMMLAQAFLMHFLGREWRWYPQQRLQEVLYHHQIIRLFGDSPSDDCPFSMHKLVEIGERTGKVPGDWYGPASVAHVFSEAVVQAPNNPLAKQICIYVAQDCTVYKQDVYDLCVRVRSRTVSGTSDEQPWTPSTPPTLSTPPVGTSTPCVPIPHTTSCAPSPYTVFSSPPPQHTPTPQTATSSVVSAWASTPGIPPKHTGSPGQSAAGTSIPATPPQRTATPNIAISSSQNSTPGTSPARDSDLCAVTSRASVTGNPSPGTAPSRSPNTGPQSPGTAPSRGPNTNTQSPVTAPSPGTSAVGEELWKTVVILVPVRLGGDCLNEVYIPCVQNMLMHKMCLGVIGGKPKHSVYFIGWQADKLVYLDPHFCQDAVDVSDRNFSVHSYHCMSPRKLQANKMDPSCTLGFLCKTRVDFETFIREAAQLTAPPVERGHYPMFTVVEGRRADVVYPPPGRPPPGAAPTPPRHAASPTSSAREQDDFVFL